MSIGPAQIVGLIDLTSLNDDDDRATAEALCAKAQSPLGPVAAVCVMPHLVRDARELLDGTPVRVATVADFPQGRGEIVKVIREVEQSVADGAHEVDVVVPWEAHVRGERQAVHLLVAACVKACAGGAQLKAILETGSHPDGATTRAIADAALEAGADFVKTSTGKQGPGASPEAAGVLLDAVRDHGRGGVKVSGGIRSAAQAAAYVGQADEVLGGPVTAERFRIGASSLLDDLLGGR